MHEAATLLDEIYAGQERMSQSEIHHRAVAAGASPRVLEAVASLPDGEYARDEVAEVIRLLAVDGQPLGVPAIELSDPDLLRELASVHRTRHGALRHGSDQALLHHDERMAELESEYLRRFPGREIDPERLAVGARARDGGPHTGP
jgi:hypothetical protein